MATKLLRIVDSKTISRENSMNSLIGCPLLIFRNFIAANSKIFDSSAAVVIMNVPTRIKMTSNSINPNAVSYEKTSNIIPMLMIPIAPMIAASVRFILSDRIRK
jgi:hypothetical protein